MPNQSPAQIMPNQSPAEILFDQMADDAANEAIIDLPALSCGTCGLCVSFGGSKNFEDEHFTILNVCLCEIEE
tara:strand:+ start:429 stop:647 length:219 start_codon:yes stop_codon:yes gene_type:complete